MKTFKIILWAIWVIAFIFEITMAVFNYSSWDTLEAVYHMLFAIFLLLCIKD